MAIATQPHDARRADTLEVFISTERVPASPGVLSNIHRGIIGLDLPAESADRPRLRISPTEILSTNRTHRKALGLRTGEPAPRDLRELHGEQLLIDLAGASYRRLTRGNTHMLVADISRPELKKFSDRLTLWMDASLSDNGRMTYLYWPSQGRQAPGRNNLIRQFMATIALGRAAKQTKNDALWTRAATNIDYNLKTFYR